MINKESGYILGKLLRLVAVVFTVSVLTFLMVDLLPGDVAYTIAGENASMEDVESIRLELGLDRNIFFRYADWLFDVLQGRFGKSFLNHEPVADAILSCLPVTIELMVIAQFLAVLLAIPAGIISAVKADTYIDKSISSAAFGVISIPVFVMALLLIFLFALKLKWLPATGYTPLSEGFLENFKSFLLPSLSLAMVEWVSLMRVLRSDMITTLQEDYILIAKSKGLPTLHILFRHALRPSSFTLITLFGIQIGQLIGGAVIVEQIFALPGIGSLLIGAIYGRDYLMVQGCILIIATGYVVVNFIVDIMYSVLDPRVRTAPAVG